MGFDDCYELGNVVKTHGLRGEVQIFLDVDDPQAYQKMESVFVDINNKLVPFFIESLDLKGDRAIVAFEDLEEIDEAKQLVGCSLYLPLDQLPPLKDGQYYFHQLVGFQLYNGDQLIGLVEQIYELPTHHLLGVNYQGTEILVPTEKEILVEVDLDQKKIITDLPDGLIEIYTENPSS